MKENISQREYLNRDVSRIMKLSPRLIVHWTEKGLVVPTIKNAEGAGKKRIYGYGNLLEFGLCKTLFNIGLAFHGTKKILDILRETGNLHDWVNNFKGYYKKLIDNLKENIEKSREKTPKEFLGILNEFEKRFVSEAIIPTEEVGMLFLFFKQEKVVYTILPYEADTKGIEYAFNLNPIQDQALNCEGMIMIDLTKIKKNIDLKI